MTFSKKQFTSLQLHNSNELYQFWQFVYCLTDLTAHFRTEWPKFILFLRPKFVTYFCPEKRLNFSMILIFFLLKKSIFL